MDLIDKEDADATTLLRGLGCSSGTDADCAASCDTDSGCAPDGRAGCSG